MGRISLPPGFRFHPTDVELVMYYLKRKVMGKKLHFEAITEVNIYDFSPWDLPDKSCLKSKDLEWFFFCPREKRYASGIRVKRSTENGFWKTTGKDRKVFYNNNIVGMVKTLVFHLGHAPQGQRTDWVIHEFRILDKQLAEAGIQDTYVLCKVFKKNGPGPKNGAQYGAPFNEADWDNDDETLICSESLPPDDPFFTASTLPKNRSSSVKTSMANPGSTSELSLIEEGPSSARPSASDLVVVESEDDIVRLLATFTDRSMLNFSEDLDNDEGNVASLPCTGGNDIYSELGDLDNWARMAEGGFDTTGMQEDGHLMNQMLLQNDVAYIELNDLVPPIDFCPEVNAIKADFRGHFSGMNPYASDPSQHPLLPEGSNRQEGCLDVLQMVNSNDVNVNLQNNSGQDLDFTFSRPTEGEDFTKSLKRGRFDDI